MAERWRQVSRLLTRPRETQLPRIYLRDGDPRLLLLPKGTVEGDSQYQNSETNHNRYTLPNPPSSIIENINHSQVRVLKSETIGSSVTESYQRDKWGPLRIALDGIQNHLPADAKATWFGVQFKSGGNWYDYSYLTDFSDDKVEAIRFLDDGKGFVPQELGVLSTSKAQDQRAAGQFGEGLKMVTAAALRHRMQMLIESRDWQAVPSFQSVKLTDRTARRLVFEVSYFPDRIPGSRTTFLKPTKNFLSIIRKLEKYVLPIQGNDYQPLASQDSVDIIDTKGNIYIKGLYYGRGLLRPFFSYNFVNLSDRATKRDRESIDPNEAEQVFKGVRRVLPLLQDEEAIKQFCQAGLTSRVRYDEFRLLYGLRLPWHLYEKAVYEIAGTDKVFLIENSPFSRALVLKKEWYLRRHGYKGLNPADGSFRYFLEGPVGIPTAHDWVLDEMLDKDKKEEIEYLSADQLSKGEKNVLDLHTMVDDFLETPKELRRRPVHIYRARKRKSDYEILFLDQERRRRVVAINRKILNDPHKFLTFFLEERANQIKGGTEASREANDLIKNRLSRLLLELKKKPHS